MSSTRVDFPLPETPVTQVKQPSGNETSIVLQIIFRRADDRQPAVIDSPARGLDALPFRESRCARDRTDNLRSENFRRKNFFECSLRDNFAAARSGAGAKIDNVIGCANRFLIVLDNNDRISQIAQPPERAE